VPGKPGATEWYRRSIPSPTPGGDGAPAQFDSAAAICGYYALIVGPAARTSLWALGNFSKFLTNNFASSIAFAS